ncbi:MAG: mammalian cell entry protein [Pseudoduganella sp.]|jgi:phospholipid/cholesterol/gamma-HCH transport system substrate-binding protein|nr:mammalian cell entry protein [Pseudoduganella sp.]
MNDTNNPPEAAPIHNAEAKAVALLVLLVALVLGAVLYLMYARGAFEPTQRLVLTADDSEGVTVGMDVTFAGFPIGRVQRIELAQDGKARILVDVPRKDAHWLRTSSIFTLEKSLVGGAKLRAFTGIPADPPLQEGAERALLVGDMAAEIPRLLQSAKDLLNNLAALTAEESALGTSLRNVQGVTEKLNGPGGALGVLTGEDQKARELLRNANSLVIKADSLVGNADKRVFGEKGIANDTQAAVQQLNALLTDARTTLKKLDAVLVEAQAVGANTREATEDLGALRAEVDANVRKIEQMINELNRKWPFKRNEPEIRLP